MVRLPVWLDWSEQRRYDLSDDADRRLMYELVIREVMNADTMRAFLNQNTLWPRLYLPTRVRTAWEMRFSVLSRPA